MTTVQDWVDSRAEGTSLGPAAHRVVKIVSTQPHLASYASTAELADRAGVNVATVVRTARVLGFSGWPQLRLELRSRYLSSLSAGQVLSEHQTHSGNPASEAIRRDIENLETLARALDLDTIRLIASAIHQSTRTIVIGSGTFAAPGVQLVHAGTSMGQDMLLERHFGTHLANTVNRMRATDTLIAVNFWWLPHQVLEATRIAAERGATTCIVTDQQTSPLTEVADHVIIVPSEGASSFPSLTAAMAVVHALLAELTQVAGTKARQAMTETESVWRRMGLFNDH